MGGICLCQSFSSSWRREGWEVFRWLSLRCGVQVPIYEFGKAVHRGMCLRLSCLRMRLMENIRYYWLGDRGLGCAAGGWGDQAHLWKVAWPSTLEQDVWWYLYFIAWLACGCWSSFNGRALYSRRKRESKGVGPSKASWRKMLTSRLWKKTIWSGVEGVCYARWSIKSCSAWQRCSLQVFLASPSGDL